MSKAGLGRSFWDGAITLSPAAKKMHNSATITSPYDDNQLDLSIFISCCNEESSILETLRAAVEAMQVVGRSYEVIIIDDASSDNSVREAKAFIDNHPELNLLLRVNHSRKGLSENYVDAAFIGCGKYFRLVRGNYCESVATLADIFSATGEADIVIPYDISVYGKNAWRQTISSLYSRLLNLLTGHRISDYHASPIHLRYNIMRWHDGAAGFGFQARLLIRLLDLGFTYKQVPCRTSGVIRLMNGGRMLSTGLMILAVALRKIRERL